MKIFHFGWTASKSLTLYTWSMGLYIPICCGRKLLWWWLSKTLIYEYSRSLLGVNLLLCSFISIVVFGFSPRSMAYLVLGSQPPEQSRAWVLSHGVDLVSNLIGIGYFNNFCANFGMFVLTTFCAIIVPAYISSRSPLQITGFVAGLLLIFLLWYMQSNF